MSESLSFARDIRPLFRDQDIEAMQSHFDLADYDDVKAHHEAILGALSEGAMPCDGAWPEENVQRLRRWVDAGMPA